MQTDVAKYTEVFQAFAMDLEKPEALRQRTIRTLRDGVRLYPNHQKLKEQLIAGLFLNGVEVPARLDEKQEMCRLCSEIIEHTDDLYTKNDYIDM